MIFFGYQIVIRLWKNVYKSSETFVRSFLSDCTFTLRSKVLSVSLKYKCAKENPNREAINYLLDSERENCFKSLREYYIILCLLTIWDKKYS
jgi:hypothetical protein